MQDGVTCFSSKEQRKLHYLSCQATLGRPVTRRLSEYKSSRCADGISCLAFSKNILGPLFTFSLHVSTDQKHARILLTHTSVFNKDGSVMSLHLQERTWVLTVRCRWMNPHSTLPKNPESFSHRPKSWEKPQRWGLAGSAQFSHQCFRLYCPVPWHQSINRKPSPGLTQLRESRNILKVQHIFSSQSAIVGLFTSFDEHQKIEAFNWIVYSIITLNMSSNLAWHMWFRYW